MRRYEDFEDDGSDTPDEAPPAHDQRWRAFALAIGFGVILGTFALLTVVRVQHGREAVRAARAAHDEARVNLDAMRAAEEAKRAAAGK